MVFNKETIDIGNYLKWYFRLVPIYNLNIGYIGITNRSVIEALHKKPKDSLQSLDWEVAGEPLYFLQHAFVLCLVCVFLVENNLLQNGLRPLLKPVAQHLEMIHLSVQRKKQRCLYTIE